LWRRSLGACALCPDHRQENQSDRGLVDWCHLLSVIAPNVEDAEMGAVADLRIA
jgi:hypothetical protein